MKYYAVTEDPNELLHYGVKGMKWGQHIFGDKPKSAGFHRALGKLRAAVNKAKTAVRNNATQAAINRNNRQQERYNKAVQKTQKRINEIEGLNSLNRLQDFEKAANRQQKAEQKQARYDAKMQKYAIKSQNIADKFSMKQQRKFTKNERKMDKYMQEAREGRLKYGKLSDEQVHKITDRLAIERNARALGSTEKPKFRTRMKEAIQEGMLKGTTQGIAAGMTEVAVAKVQNRMRNKAILDKQAKQKASREHEANRIRNKKSHKEMREDIKNEAYEAQVRAGTNMWNRNQWLSTAGAAKALQEANSKIHESQRKLAIDDKIKNELQFENDKDYQKMLANRSERERVRKLNETINNALDMDRNEDYQNLLTRQEEQKFLTDEAHNSVRVARQNRENEERAERQREITAELAYKYGLFPGSNGGGGSKDKGKNNKGGGASGFNSIEEAKKYYELKYINGETLQDVEARKAARNAEIAAKRAETLRRKRELDELNRRREEGKKAAEEWAKNNRDSGIPVNIMPLDRNRRVTNNMNGEVVDNLLGEPKRRRRRG